MGVFASRIIVAGERVLMERPLALTIAMESRTHICAVCLEDSRKMQNGAQPTWILRCEGCAALYFCSEDCFMAAKWRHTPLECAALDTALKDPEVDEEVGDQVAQAIRILCDRAEGVTVDIGLTAHSAEGGTGGEGARQSSLSLGFNAYADRLVGVMPLTAEGRASLRTTMRATLRALPECARIDQSEMLGFLMRHQCNLYGVSGCAGESVACASFAGFFHLFNHACCPNLAFDGARPSRVVSPDGSAPTFALVAISDIPEGAELCITCESVAR